MITKAARAPFVPSPLGPIKSMLGPFSDQVDASCLVLRGLGQVDASHGFMDAVGGLQGDSLCCNFDLQTFDYFHQALQVFHQRGSGAYGALAESCATQDASVTALVTDRQ